MRAIGCVVVVSAVVGCGGPGAGATGDPVARVVGAARRAVALPRGTPGVVTDAVVQGPGYEFRTRTHSGADGTLRMEQTTGFLAVLTGGESWGRRSGEWVSPLDPFDEAFARGHELHALAFWPETRMTEPTLLGVVPFLGGEAIGVRWRVSAIGTQTVFYSVDDTLPIGLRAEWVEPPVDIRFGPWAPVARTDRTDGASPAGPRLFHTATFDQAGEVFEYRYERIEFAPVADSLLVPPGSDGRATREGRFP